MSACAPTTSPATAPANIVLRAAELLFVNGQTTETLVQATHRLAEALGFSAVVLPRWGELTVELGSADGRQLLIADATPLGIDMGKVAAVMGVIERICCGRTTVQEAMPALDTIGRRPPISAARFALMAAAGAAALGVIFGDMHPITLGLIAVSAGLGACLRRWLATMSTNPFIQPFGAALLAGIIGAIAVKLQLSSALRLVAVCPCMVLVPGPHILNGAIDLVRTRIALGASRIAIAGMIIVMICAGLLLGLASGGAALPTGGVSGAVPFAYDVIAAGVAVAAYGTFFAMPWKILPIPIAIGMIAHASRWLLISLLGAGAVSGACAASLVAGMISSPLADRTRMPFGALAFTSVVSLIPGIFLFRMASGLVELIGLGDKAPVELLLETVTDGTTALLIVLAISFGVIVPRFLLQYLWPGDPRKAPPE
jgi:uncharacterized membrane protein YjjP (DUF1212 family)